MIYFTKNLLTEHVMISYSNNILTLVRRFVANRLFNSGELEIIAVYEGDIKERNIIKEEFTHVRGSWYKYHKDMENLSIGDGNKFEEEPTLKSKLNKHLNKSKHKKFISHKGDKV